jgi:hypothetical protein
MHMPAARLAQISATSPFQSQLKASTVRPHRETRLNITHLVLIILVCIEDAQGQLLLITIINLVSIH